MTQIQRRLLLVDDEQPILDALRRLLRPYRAVWDVTTTTSPSAAMLLLDTTPFDVIISDMRMPEIDGVELLSAAQDKCPSAMRIILSGQVDSSATSLRAIGVAHQFLAKPTELLVLLATVRRVFREDGTFTHAAASDANARARVGRLEALPSAPRLFKQLVKTVSADSSVADLVAAIEPDPAIVLKLLQLVNSAFFGLRRTITSTAEAVAYLGTNTVRSIVMSLSILNALPVRARHFDADAFQRRSFTIAQLARRISRGTPHVETTFVAALLEGIGKLTLAFCLPDLFDEITTRSLETQCSFEEAESALCNFDHRDLGVYLLDLWGLPAAITEALTAQEHVVTRGTSELAAADAVFIARRLVDCAEAFTTDAERDYLDRVGVLNRLPELSSVL